MKPSLAFLAATLAFAGMVTPRAFADEKPAAAPAVALPDDADKAWGEVEASLGELRAKARTFKTPADGQPLFADLADKSRAFAGKFPTHLKAPMARNFTSQALLSLASSDEKREAELVAYLDTSLADKSLPEDERVRFFILKNGQLPVVKKIRSNPAAAAGLQEEMQESMTESLLAAQKEFPANAGLYGQILGIARDAKGGDAKRLAKVIVDAEAAPAEFKQTAQDILDGKRPYEVGKPLDIKFTAVDGREVDLSKMKGKVVLIDFWATWCGPCVAELPHVKEVYGKYHEKGFEIVGISFDNEKGDLTDFVKEREMPWPQFFDGKGWQNPYGVKYGITGIPTMWLVGKDGNLADINARGGLDQKVAKLLEAKEPAQQ